MAAWIDGFSWLKEPPAGVKKDVGRKRGWKHTAETKAKMSKAKQNMTAETKAKIGAGHRGKTVSAETRSKLSASAKKRYQ